MAISFKPLGKKIEDVLGGLGNVANKTGQTVGNAVLGLPVISDAVRFGQQKNPTLGDFTKGIFSTGYNASPLGSLERTGGRIAATITQRPQVSLTGTSLPVNQEVGNAAPILGNRLLGQGAAALGVAGDAAFGGSVKPALDVFGRNISDVGRINRGEFQAPGRIGAIDQFVRENERPGLPAPAPNTQLALPAGLGARDAGRTPGGAVIIDPESGAARVVANAGKPSVVARTGVEVRPGVRDKRFGYLDNMNGRMVTSAVIPGRRAALVTTSGKNLQDLAAPAASGSPERVAAAGRSLVDTAPNRPQARSITDVTSLVKRATKQSTGEGVDTQAQRIKTLNQIIEHTDASPETKAWAIEQRNQIAPSKPKVSLKQPVTRPLAVTTDAPSSKPLVAQRPQTAQVTGPKERGFAKNLAKNNLDEDPTINAVIESIPGHQPITNQDTLLKAAEKIEKDPSSAQGRFINKRQLTSADDVATGNLLLRRAIESEDIGTAIEIGRKLGMDGTKLGQAVQAYATWKRTTPEGILRYASKQAEKAGRPLKPEVAQNLVDRAKAAADMPEGVEKARATRELTAEAAKQGRTWKDAVGNILNAPRAALATADFSAPLRQGAVLGSRFPKQFAQSAVDSAKYMFNPKNYEKSMYELTQRPNYALMKSNGLAVKAAEHLNGTEEQFMTSFLEGKIAKKLGVGHIVAASDRAYSGFLTKFRADVFDKVVGDAKTAGVELDKKALTSLTKFINSASGRGSGKLLDRHVGLLSSGLFSPRLWKSRIDTLNPAYYARLDPTARKYALQSAASFLGIVSTVLGVAKASGAQVEMDPRSADFAKIKVGNTRYDILGGHQQNIRLIAQMVTGQKINSETGELQTLGPDRGYGKPSRLDLLYQFIENKENPVVSFATKALRGTDPTGQPINLAAEAGKLAIPLNAQSIYDTAKDQHSLAKGAAMNIPGIFGLGVQTYGGSPSAAPSASSPTTSPTASPTSTPDNGSILTGDNTTPEAKAAVAQANATKKADLASGARLGGTKELDAAQTRIDSATAKLPDGLSDDSKTTLTRYAKLNSDGKDKFNADLNNVYDLKVAQYEQKKRSGELDNTLDDYKAQADVYRAGVQKDFSPTAVKLYGMSKSALKDYFAANPDQQKLFGEVQKLDGALTNAGLQDKNKFANGLGSNGSSGSSNPYKYAVSASAGNVAKPKVSFHSSRGIRSVKSAKTKSAPKAKVSIRKGVL